MTAAWRPPFIEVLMTDPRQFPILSSSRQQVGPEFPSSVPWDKVAAHEAQALKNHDQTLQRLADRGGLGWSELELILLDKEWDGRSFRMPAEREAYAAHEKATAQRVVKLLGLGQ